MASPPSLHAALGKRKRDGDNEPNDQPAKVAKPLFVAEHESTDEDEFDYDDLIYSETQESFPRCAAYDSEFTRVRSRIEELSKEVADLLESSDCMTEIVSNMCTEAAKLYPAPEPKRPVIGLLAAAGQGKSSLINSCADIAGLAKAGSKGDSCTYVAMLFQKADPDQEKKFSATIEYYQLETIAILLTNALQDWEMWQCHQDPDWELEQRKQFEHRAVTCLSTFRAIFCSLPYFANKELAETMLNTIVKSKSPREKQLEVYMSLAAEQLEDKMGPDGKYTDYFEAHTTDELHDLVDPLVSECVDDGQPTLWPFVKQVSVGVRDSRVLDHFTLVDLPGVSDTNQVRVKATYEQMDRCDYVWIVGVAMRIITDDFVDGLMQRYGRIHKGKVAIIVTQTDANIDDDSLAKDLANKGYSLGTYQKMKNTSRQLKKLVKRYNKEKGRPGKTPKEKAALQAEIDDSSISIHTLDTQCLALIVQARNGYITTSLQRDKVRHLPKGSTLNIHCISNLHYAAHKGAAEVSGALLDPTASGVPGLRSFALEQAAPTTLQTLEDYITHEFSVVFQGLWIFAEQKWGEGRDELLSIVQEPQALIEGLLIHYSASITDMVHTNIVGVFGEHQGAFASRARSVLNGMKSSKWPTLRAYIPRYGNHSTSAMPKRSWNRDFSLAACRMIPDLVEQFQEAQAELVTTMQRKLVEAVKDLPRAVRAKPTTRMLPLDAFEGALAAHVRGIENVFRDSQEAMAVHWRHMITSTCHDRENGPFQQAMKECYDLCMAKKGKGVKDKLFSAFEAHLSLAGKRSPFAVLAAGLQDMIVSAAEEQIRGLQTAIGRVLRQLVQQADTMITSKEIDPSETPVRDAIREFLVDGKPRFEAIKTDLEKLKRAYPS